MFCKLSLLFIILITTTTIAQNNLFEKVYQKGFNDLEYKFLKRDSSGFAVYTESVGVNNNPYLSYNCIHHCNDTGLILQQTEINLVPEFWERIEVLDWYNTVDENFIVN
jgi:IMP cyclohydrolase